MIEESEVGFVVGAVGREKVKGALGELNHDRIVGLFYISLILLPFPRCHLFTEINISLALALLMILMLALPAGMSFKGQRQLTRGFTTAILHSVCVKIRKEGAKVKFSSRRAKAIPLFIISSHAFLYR